MQKKAQVGFYILVEFVRCGWLPLLDLGNMLWVQDCAAYSFVCVTQKKVN
jgi:hypothetical protein